MKKGGIPFFPDTKNECRYFAGVHEEKGEVKDNNINLPEKKTDDYYENLPCSKITYVHGRRNYKKEDGINYENQCNKYYYDDRFFNEMKCHRGSASRCTKDARFW